MRGGGMMDGCDKGGIILEYSLQNATEFEAMQTQ